jgi:hypothetical protein
MYKELSLDMVPHIQDVDVDIKHFHDVGDERNEQISPFYFENDIQFDKMEREKLVVKDGDCFYSFSH